MPPPSNRRAFPDKAHEDLARWVEETVADVRTNRDDIGDSFLLVDTLFGLGDAARADDDLHRADIGDSLLLVDVLFSLLDAATALIDAHRIRIDAVKIQAQTAIDGMDALQVAMAALVDRVTVLEGHHVTLSGPDAAG